MSILKGLILCALKFSEKFFLLTLGELNIYSDLSCCVWLLAKSSRDLGFFLNKYDAAETESIKNTV